MLVGCYGYNVWCEVLYKTALVIVVVCLWYYVVVGSVWFMLLLFDVINTMVSSIIV